MRIDRAKAGDHVRPRPEWRNDSNQIPTGTVRRIEIWGSEGALYVGAEPRAFAAYVFEQIEPRGPTPGTVIRPR